MLQSMWSERVEHDFVTEQPQQLERNKILFAHDIIMYIENPKEYIFFKSATMNNSSMFAGYKRIFILFFNIKEFLYFLCIECTKRNVKYKN